MIQIKNKKDCCGCNACVQRCPKQCITMQADNEGFLYPIVNTASCIDCGLCEKVCPVINQAKPQQPLKVYAAYNKNEDIRMKSSSGGIFTLLAEETIRKGGIVFGVKFNKDWMTEFAYAETMEDIAPFRGSKYVQAIVGNAYKKTEEFLKAGKEVLFSGTPCQIAGLKRFLRKEYENLLTVDIICHGVPSPKVWNMYLQEACSKLLTTIPTEKKSPCSANSGTDKPYIESISFRSKITGWKKYSFLLKLNFSNLDGKNTDVFAETLDKNAYMRAFLNDTILRPSCYSCPAKQGKSHADITIADFWGINVVDPTFDDDKGCGLILVNNEKGKNVYQSIDTIHKKRTLNEGIKYNSAYSQSSRPHPNRNKFFEGIDNTECITDYIYDMDKLSFKEATKKTIKKYACAILRRIKNRYYENRNSHTTA